jgi:hypothetical protein
LSSRYGDRTDDVNRRPAAPRVHTGDEETVVEKMWQPLFDARGEPTARLGQFLRGLALHLVSFAPALLLGGVYILIIIAD